MAGGGAAAEEQSRGAPEEEEREKEARGRCEISQTSRDSDVKPNFLTALELKQKCDQNESCTTFQALQLYFIIQFQKLKGYSFILKLGVNFKLNKVLSLLR
jgi:hypothetical protein